MCCGDDSGGGGGGGSCKCSRHRRIFFFFFFYLLGVRTHKPGPTPAFFLFYYFRSPPQRFFFSPFLPYPVVLLLPVKAGIIEPLLAMLTVVTGNDVDISISISSSSSSSRNSIAPAGAGGNDTHAAALAMELLVILATSPKLTRQLQRAGAIPAVVAWLEPVDGGRKDKSTRSSLLQNALTVLASMVRFSGEYEGEKEKKCVLQSRSRRCCSCCYSTREKQIQGVNILCVVQ